MGIFIIGGLLLIGLILFFCFAKPRDQTPITYEEQQRRADKCDEKNSDKQKVANFCLFCINPIAGIILMISKKNKDKKRQERKEKRGDK